MIDRPPISPPRPVRALWIRAAIALWVLLSSAAMAAPRFSHDDHQRRLDARGEGATCKTCHGVEWQLSEQRPGKTTHRSCDGPGCHADDFYSGEAGWSFCEACHVNARPWSAGELLAFPGRSRSTREMCIKFDHVAHLSESRRSERSVDEMCGVCHTGQGNTRQSPGHAACATCHTRAASAIPMSECERCHASLTSLNAPGRDDGPGAARRFETCRPWLPDRGSRIVAHFDHDRTHHRTDLGGEPLSCNHCHRGAATTRDPRLIRMFPGTDTMERCRACHDGSKRVPGTRKRIFSTTRNCYGCHAKGALDARLGTPRSHR